MADRESSGRKRKTALHEARTTIGVRQEEMAKLTGIPLRTYQRLESGELTNPPIRYLVNCAIALTLELDEVCEPEWLEWLPTGTRAEFTAVFDGSRDAGGMAPTPPQIELAFVTIVTLWSPPRIETGP